METCRLCKGRVPSLTRVSIFTPEGIWVCSQCYELFITNRYKPYSKVMDRLALAEAGYYANRKRARGR